MPTLLLISATSSILLTTRAPRVIAEIDKYQFKVVKLLGEFVWHKHDDTDETFYRARRRSYTVVFLDGEVTLEAGKCSLSQGF